MTYFQKTSQEEEEEWMARIDALHAHTPAFDITEHMMKRIEKLERDTALQWQIINALL